MKKGTHYLMALLITLLVSVATVEAATEITSLPWTITTQGSYIIKQNLKANWHGIIVKANNVTIDLNGYSIAGNNTSGGYGVYMNGCSNVEIRNGTIRNFGLCGIYEGSSGDSHRVINVRVVKNKNYGISLDGSNHMVKDCTVSNNMGGISAGSRSTVSGNAVYSNGYYGIFADAGSTVSGNTADDNAYSGIYAGSGSTISGNTAFGNGNNGISTGSGSTVKNNTAYFNRYDGIHLGGNDLVDGNTAYDNNQSGGSYVNISTCATCVFGDNVQ
jgi:parallel beta-helix repeat protein